MAACNFKPLYQSNSGGVNGLKDIKVRIIADREGQILSNKLRHALTPYGQPRHPKYELAVHLSYTDRDLGISKDATTTRSQIVLDTSYSLKDFRTGKIVYKDRLKSIADYNILKSSYYSNVVSEKSARKDLLNEVAESIKVSLASYLDYEMTLNENNPRTV